MLWFFLYSILIFITKTLPMHLSLLAITLLGISLTQMNFYKIFRKIRYLIYFLPFTFFVHLFFGTPFLRNLSGDGSLLAQWTMVSRPLLYTFRIFNFILLMSWFTDWVSSEKVIDGIYLLLKPLEKIRIPVEDLFQVIFIAIRFFPILQEEYGKIEENWRNYRKDKGDENKILILLNNLVSLLVLSLRRAEKIALAMQLRGYGTGKRSYFTKLRFSFRDWSFCIFSILFFWMVNKLGGFFETFQV